MELQLIDLKKHRFGVYQGNRKLGELRRSKTREFWRYTERTECRPIPVSFATPEAGKKYLQETLYAG